MENDVVLKIQGGRTVSKELVEKANAEIVAKKEESLRKEMVQALTNAEYKIDYRRLSLRRARALGKVEEDAIASTGTNLERLKAGGITPEAWQEEEDRIESELEKAKNKVRTDYSTLLEQHNRNNPETGYRVAKGGF